MEEHVFFNGIEVLPCPFCCCFPTANERNVTPEDMELIFNHKKGCYFEDIFDLSNQNHIIMLSQIAKWNNVESIKQLENRIESLESIDPEMD